MAASAHYIVLKEVEKVRSYSFNHCAYSLLRIATPHLYQQNILPKWRGLNESGNIAISDIQIASFMCVSCCLLKHYPSPIRYRKSKLRKKWS